MEAEQWFKDRVRRGIVLFSEMGLARGPHPNDNDRIDTLVGIWVAALSEGRKWNYQRDVEVIEATFAKMRAGAGPWPQPKEFLEELRYVRERERDKALFLPQPKSERTEAERVKAKANFSKIQRMLLEKRVKKAEMAAQQERESEEGVSVAPESCDT
jgi:hypothetical protein